MNPQTLRQYLDDPAAAAGWLRGLGVVDLKQAHADLVRMAEAGITLDLLAGICQQLGEHLRRCADPDMALSNLDRFVAAARNPIALGAFFERDRDSLPALLQIFDSSQHFSDVLVTDHHCFDVLQLTAGRPVEREVLTETLAAEIEALEHDDAVLRALRRFKRRETLRIAYGDIVREQPLQTVTEQISFLADAILEAALRAARRKLQIERGRPIGPAGQPARFVVLAMGKLGGRELNYSSDVDLIFIYDGEGHTDGRRPTSNAEFFAQLAREIVRMTAEPTDLGSAYRVDLRLRPEGDRGPVVCSLQSALAYYDVRGRTWERQAYIKAWPVAGDLELGHELLRRLAPWIYRRYLGLADISGIKALKRRIERPARHETADRRNVKTGHGGIRDVEFVIQFLQMLNGGDLTEVRTGNTLEAIARLERVGCLSSLEQMLLSNHYVFLRTIEHRLQIMFDLQTHVLPERPDDVRKLALRMGYAETKEQSALEAFERDYRDKTRLNRRILDHLLHDAFIDDDTTEAEVDLVLDPDPPPEQIDRVLGKHAFRDVGSAYRNLTALAREKIRFLSTRRCRHFLAAIAPRLLRAVAATPDPDSTLVNLNRVSDSLGGKGALWELFSFNPPSLRLYVDLCAYSPYLSNLLTSNPGMIDGLMDSLVLDRLPRRESLRQTLAELCRAAEDVEPILHSFKNDRQLRVGVRDLLGKEDVQPITAVLSEIAETCLRQIAAHELGRLTARFGQPQIDEGPRAGKPCEMVILAMGKFGGQEMSYYSDLDLVFLYEAEGHTKPLPGQAQRTTNRHFFSELGRRIIKVTSQLGPHGRLYEVDVRLRPTGKSGPLATALPEFARYFAEGDSVAGISAQFWERQALCKARVVFGSARAAKAATSAVGKAAFAHRWSVKHVEEIRRMRRRLEETAEAGDLKRGPGGIVDVEFLVQLLQLKHGRRNAKIRQPKTLAALAELYAAGYFSAKDYDFLDLSYRLLRTIEGRLCLMNSADRDRLPDDPTELKKLAHLLDYATTEALLRDYENSTRQIRERYDRILNEEAGA
ncbi:MAG: bifunctional [glutamate--ammonia ligase]-adenylyl-L-tyrosine phosphorylase/[glutamate--ammonia-ligase] adenylyltransferase [Candidatus Nealsonbacteria bacterium]|nr:bifunctional [glutamate--ammonia ligase]-adenylyl-L-tyrosine phosphorylase/[glutamate--ammonia-ligase] adenylyltransferase [Candidatus Nealsonbacteria bacterium]